MMSRLNLLHVYEFVVEKAFKSVKNSMGLRTLLPVKHN